MADIDVNIIDGVANISQRSFGITAIFGETDQYKILKVGFGKSQLVVVTAVRDGTAEFKIVQSGSVISFAAASTVVTLTIPTTGATAKQVKDNFDANAYSPVKALISLQLPSSGTGAVAVFTQTPLANFSEAVLESKDEVDNLLPYYTTSDKEYIMAVKLFNQDLKPEKVYVFNASGESSSSDDFTQVIGAFDHQDFYFLLLSNTTKLRAKEASNWNDAQSTGITVHLCEDTTLLDDLELNTRSAVVLTTDDANRNDACIVGVQAAKTPGSTTWKWKKANGAVAETDASLISTARANNGNVFIEKSGVTFFIEGIMTNGLFIDQRHQRDYMAARIEEAFLALFTSEEKIPYDDTGIAQLVSTLSDKLNSFGDGGIIARAVSESEMATSYNKVYQYTIIAPTRAQMLANDPDKVVDRIYPLEFHFVEAGAIHDLVVTGKVLLSLN